MATPSEYVLETIRDGAEFTLYRARQRGNDGSVREVNRQILHPVAPA